jgi:hypothetical protein
LRLAEPAVGELPDVPVAAQRADHQQRDRLHVLQGPAMDGDVEPGVERVTGCRALEDETIHRHTSAQMSKIARSNNKLKRHEDSKKNHHALEWCRKGWYQAKSMGRLRLKSSQIGDPDGGA